MTHRFIRASLDQARLSSEATMSGLEFTEDAKLGLSRNTVRTHLKSLFAKAGTRRQVELISLAALAIAPASTRELDVI
jgi:hypothetical protein